MSKHKVTIEEGTVTVYIRQNNGLIHLVLLDTIDWDWIKNYSIFVMPSKQNFRVWIRDYQGNRYLLHRVIVDATTDIQVDHENGNQLDNRRKNLRPCTHAENQQNKHTVWSNTGIRGVYYQDNRYRVQLTLNKKKYHLGYYEDIKEAERVITEFRANNLPFSKEARRI